jgi:cytochrome d ubiquinol oxidase subunit II
VSLEIVLAGSMLASLTFYALLGGADYGGGVWDLFVRGPRANDQRAVIAHAIGPIWEANHVWLILVVVVLFTAFPPAFAAIATALAHSADAPSDRNRTAWIRFHLSHLRLTE